MEVSEERSLRFELKKDSNNKIISNYVILVVKKEKVDWWWCELDFITSESTKLVLPDENY